MVKTKLKHFILIFMLMVLAFCFCGCSSVTACVITNEDNTIDEFVSITLDTNAILESGRTILEVKNYIYDLSYSKAENMCDDLNSKINTHLFLGVTEETAKILNSYKNGMQVITSTWQDNNLTIGVRYSSPEIYKYYYNIEENTNPQYQIEEHYLYNKVYYYGYSIYVKHFSLYNSVKNDINYNMPELASVGNCELLYTYVTESGREHSDANYVNKVDSKYYHTWVVDENKIDKPIMIYYNIANTGNWIILGVIISLAVCLILLIIGLVISKINRKKLKNNKNN